MTRHIAAHLADVISQISAGPNDTYDGPRVVEITLWDLRKIFGSYAEAEDEPDIVSESEFIEDYNELQPLVEALVNRGTSFITQTGQDENLCTIIWEIHEA